MDTDSSHQKQEAMSYPQASGYLRSVLRGICAPLRGICVNYRGICAGQLLESS